MEKYYSN